MTADATRIERDLEQRDIALFASDEPMTANATAILTRRVKQGVAEWYVRDLIEKSRRGMEESVRQGWHTGGPAPYGYQLDPHDHPNPQKAREGRKKHRLITDPVTAPIVSMIFEDYCLHGLGLGAICDKLNAHLDRYPPPTRNKKDENDLPQTWSRSQLQAMLRNPKYTGFNVWGRHDKRPGRPFIRPRDQWVWSPAPSHEAIVSRELFDQVEERAVRNHRGATLRGAEDVRTAVRSPQRTPLRTSRSHPLPTLRPQDGRQPPEGLELVPLPVRLPARHRRGRRGRAPARARHPRRGGARTALRLPRPPTLRPRPPPPPAPTNSPPRSPTATTAALRSSPASTGSLPNSTRPSVGRRSASKSTTIPTILSSPLRRPESRNSPASAPHSTSSAARLESRRQQRTGTAGDRSAARIAPGPPPGTRPLRARRAGRPLRRVRRHGHLRQAEPLARARRHHHRRPRTGPRKTATASSAVAEFRYSGGRI